MRTTLDLDDELLRTAKAISESRRETLSRVISELAWKGLQPESASYKTRNGFPVLKARASARPFAADHVRKLASESEDGRLAAELLR